MFKTINGFTKASMKRAIRAGNNGHKSKLSPSNKMCAYRAPDGNKCAVGCFIPDEVDLYAVEGKPVSELENFIFPLSVRGMEFMQAYHDSYRGKCDMRDVLCRWIDRNVKD